MSYWSTTPRRAGRVLRAASIGAVLVLATACSPDGSSGATLPADDVRPAAREDVVATDLAPSQVSAETVPAPSTPGPCAAADLELWTAQVLVTGDSTDAVVRIRNAGDAWCEPDIRGSTRLDPTVEPDVWLQPGEWADLVVGPADTGCDDPSVVGEVDVSLNGRVVVVPTALVVCEWWLTAFYPADGALAACDPSELDVVVVADAVLVRNSSFRSCHLGELVAVAAEGAAIVPRTDDAHRIDDLAGGDVVAFARLSEPGGECAGGPGVLTFSEAGTVAVPGIGCPARYELGAGRPWFGDPEIGPPANERVDADAVLALLDPFGEERST